jgi:hypothetical protein
VCVCLCCPSVKWPVEPRSTSSRATSFFISLGHTGRCYGVLLCRTDASHSRRACFWLPFFLKTGRNASCHERAMRSLTASTFFTTRPRAKGGRGMRYAGTIVDAHHALWCRSLKSRVCDSQPDRINIFYHEASGETRPRRTLRPHDC